jgi:hypothetical protein
VCLEWPDAQGRAEGRFANPSRVVLNAAYGPRSPRPEPVSRTSPTCGTASLPFELTGSRLHREIRELGYSGGGYTAVTEFLCEPAASERRFEVPSWICASCTAPLLVLRQHAAPAG